jgi:hypothetical protein
MVAMGGGRRGEFLIHGVDGCGIHRVGGDGVHGVDGGPDATGAAPSIPAHEYERLRRVGARRGHSVDSTHPPTHLRRTCLLACRGQDTRSPMTAPKFEGGDHSAVIDNRRGKNT